MEKIEKWKLLADLFLRDDTQVFIKEENGDLHFCKIILNGNDSILIENFGPEQRAGKREKIYWLLIKEFDKFEEKE